MRFNPGRAASPTKGNFSRTCTHVVLTVALALTALASASVASASTGGGTSTATSTLGLGTVTFTAHDGEFDGNQAQIPITFTFDKTRDKNFTAISAQVDLDARQVGSSTTIGFLGNSVYWGTGSSKTGTGSAIMTINGFNFVPGQPVLIYGSANFADTFTPENIQEGVAFNPVIAINIAQEVTTLRDVGVINNKITGRATVESSVGTTGTDGFIAVRYKKPGSKEWVRVDDYLNCYQDRCQFVNDRGEFDLTPEKRIPTGSRVEITLLDCNWCTNASVTVKAN